MCMEALSGSRANTDHGVPSWKRPQYLIHHCEAFILRAKLSRNLLTASLMFFLQQPAL